MADPKIKVVVEADDTQAKKLEATFRNLQRAAEAVGKSTGTMTVASGRAEQAIQKQAAATQRAAQQTVTAKSAVDSFATTLRNVTFAAGAMGAVLQKTFDLAKQGAQITQTATAFDYFATSVVGIPDLLDQLKAGADGTITEFELMSNTLTLVAGTTQETGKQLATAAPQLLEIARAAQVLNPALGDVTYFYESLNTGIKRLERRWLDNLGLVVKAQDAYAAYAQQLGKSTQALTAEEKTQAFLNETLRVGQLLIEQVGGSVESAVDPWSRLEVQITEVGNALKQALAEGLLPWIQAINQDNDQAVQTIVEDNLAAASSMEDLIGQIQRLNEVYGMWTGLAVAVTGSEDGVQQAIMDTATAVALQADTFAEFEQAIASLDGRAQAYFESQLTLTNQSTSQFYENARAAAADAAEVDRLLERSAALAGTTQDLTLTEEGLAAMQNALMFDVIATTNAIEDYSLRTYEATKQQNLLTSAVALGLGPMIRWGQGLSNAANQALKLKKANDAATQSVQTLATVSAGAASAFINALEGGATGGGGGVSAIDAAAQAQQEWNAAFAQSFIQLLDAKEPIENWNTELLKSAAAAGASAETLALLAAATGEYSEEQIRTALHGAAMKQAIEEISQALVDGRATSDEALAAVAGFQEQLAQGGDLKLNLEAYGIESLQEIAEGAAGSAGSAASETQNWTDNLLKLASQGKLTIADLILLAESTGEYTDAQIRAAVKTALMQQKIEELAQQIGKRPLQSILDDLHQFESDLDKEFALIFSTGDAEEAIGRVSRGIAELPDKKTIIIEIKADPVPDLSNIPGSQNAASGSQIHDQHGGPLGRRAQHGNPLVGATLVGEVRPELVVGGQVIPRIPPGFFMAQEGFTQAIAAALASNMTALPSYTSTTNINRTSTVNNMQRSIIINAPTSGAFQNQTSRELGAF
jgi:hypothetical protein